MPLRAPAIAALVLPLALTALLAPPARAQVVNEGTAAESNAREMKPPPPQQQQPQAKPTRLTSYDQPPVDNPDSPAPVGGLSEEDRIGDYGQPRWTAVRRFVETRVYVLPPGYFDLEWWLIPTVPRHGGKTETEMQFEGEMGLGHRLQLDLYMVLSNTGRDGNFTVTGGKIEGRWAFADWGKLPGNPTVYAEYEMQSGGPDLCEFKLLLGDEITSRWHWGTNLVWERELSGDLTNDFEVNGGLSYAILDSQFSAGIESKNTFTNAHGSRGHFDENIFLGPSVQWRPVLASHIDIAPLVGLTEKTPALQLFIVAGWEF
jgi:hypothetical protein